ncbi:AraC family transcriptional regulator [Devosia algicola]|uniref:AraC family transcriptional regulator n=1 Tax=Devosia algicola TaxID=3026418 RepID=A0ABY7YSL1_9HYPH|nr:AraC family transcriptional regulator [Devosia algicola]WDR04325.1 AraC family transcriptional regulator [Devosia algicola]
MRLHAHHAIQVSVGLSGRVQFRTSNSDAWQSYDAVMIPPDRTHTFQAPGKTIAHLFCEPESVLGRALRLRFGGEDICAVAAPEISQRAAHLASAFDDGQADENIEEIVLEALYSLAERIVPQPVDQRIKQAMTFIWGRLADTLTLEDVATHVGLSPGRFRHLFVQETGISFRSYLLWTRLNRALDLGYTHGSWTNAAHATNFADSAHLTRTARRMYGFAPRLPAPEWAGGNGSTDWLAPIFNSRTMDRFIEPCITATRGTNNVRQIFTPPDFVARTTHPHHCRRRRIRCPHDGTAAVRSRPVAQ